MSANIDSTEQVTECGRRSFVKACALATVAAAFGVPGVASAATANFTLYAHDEDGNQVAKVDIYRTRSNVVRCQVFEKDSKKSWVSVGAGHYVSVRQTRSASRFDEQKTDASGETDHSAISYTSGMSIEVVVPDYDISGSGTLL